MVYSLIIFLKLGQPVAQLVQALWVRLELFKDLILGLHYGPGINSASNRKTTSAQG